VAQWHNRVIPTGHAKARDYEDTVYHLIIKACHEYEACIGGKCEWPELDKQIVWAQDAWKKACEVVKEEYELPDRIMSLVCFSNMPCAQTLTSCRSSNGVPVLVENSSTGYAAKLQQLTVSFTVTIRQPFVTIRNCTRDFLKAMLFTIRYNPSNCMKSYSFL
jgi:hypothetical protein